MKAKKPTYIGRDEEGNCESFIPMVAFEFHPHGARLLDNTLVILCT